MSESLFKKGINNVVFILLMIAPTIVWGQSDSLTRDYQSPCQSEWTKYNNFTEQKSIVRSNDQNHVTYIHEKTISGPSRHIFVVRKNSMTPVTAFSAFDCCQNCLCSTVEITDMRLFDGTCYFCGKWKPFMSLLQNTKGFVGRFKINDMLYNTGSVYYHIVDTVTQLTRLAISKDNGVSLLISAIGTTKTDNRACIIELEDTGSSLWAARIEQIEENYEIIFSDIMTFKDSITLLAQYACVNDNLPESYDYDNNHQIFLLDRFGLNGCYHSYSSPHNMFRYFLSPSESYIFHYSKAPMRLFHINDEQNMFGVAFGVEKWDGSIGGIRLFQFHNACQYSKCIFYQTGLHAEIRDIGNRYKTDNLFVLSIDNTHTNGLIAIPQQNGTSNNVFWLTNDSYTYNSLTQKIVGPHIDISGHDNAFGFHLFDQNINQITLPTCFDTTINQYVVFPEHHATPIRITWKNCDLKACEWNTGNTNPMEITTDIICEFCNEQ